MLIYVCKCVKPNHFYFIYFLLLYEMPVNSFEFILAVLASFQKTLIGKVYLCRVYESKRKGEGCKQVSRVLSYHQRARGREIRDANKFLVFCPIIEEPEEGR